MKKLILLPFLLITLFLVQSAFAQTDAPSPMFCLGGTCGGSISPSVPPSSGPSPTIFIGSPSISPSTSISAQPSGEEATPSASLSPSVSGTPSNPAGPICTSFNQFINNLTSGNTTLNTKVHIKCGSGGGGGKGSKGNNGSNPNNGLISQLLSLIIQLLLELLQLCGAQSTTGTPTPSISPSIALPSVIISILPSQSLSGAPSGGAPSTSGTPSSSSSAGTPVTVSSCTNPVWSSSNPTGTWDNGGFDVYNNMWNSTAGPQTVSACAYNSWYVVSNQPKGTAVQTYPDVQMNYSGKTVSTYKTLASSFSESAPTNSDYDWEAAYDIWVNGLATSGSTEVMIWTDNHGQTPSGSTQGTATIDGATYTVWKGGSTISFVRSTNESSGTVDIEPFFQWLITKGWLTSTDTLSQINFGWEICSTDGTDATFKLTGFSLTNN